MKRILLVGTSAKQIAQVKEICGKSFMIDQAEQLNHVAFQDVGYSVLLLLIDNNPQQYLSELEIFTLKPVPYMPPILLVTEHPEALYIRKAIRRGAIDYVDIKRHYFLVLNRVLNIMKLAKKYSSHVESMNRLLFHRCMGPALLLDITNENVIHAIMINSEFYELMGFSKNHFNQVPDLMDTALPSERESLIRAISDARINGISECVVSQVETRRLFRLTFRLVTKGEASSFFLVTVEDITNELLYQNVAETMLQLPGMVLFDYDVKEDTTHLYITTKKDQKITRTVTNCTDPKSQKWIAPESFPLYLRTIAEASLGPRSGKEDLRILMDGQLKWHRMYYRSVADPTTGSIYRIVGRFDDMETEDWMDVKGIHSGVCDVETHLPTFHTTCQFIDQFFRQKKEGILLLLYIGKLEQKCKSMSTFDRQALMQGLVRTINNQLFATDIIGRFDAECFIIFMPETTSHNVAAKKAEALIKEVRDFLPSDDFTCNAGVTIITENHESLDSITSETSIALWKAVRNGNGSYLIFNDV